MLALKSEFALVTVYTRFMVIILSGKSRMIFSVQTKVFKVSAKKIIFCPFLNWNSLQARLSYYSDERTYKRKKHE